MAETKEREVLETCEVKIPRDEYNGAYVIFYLLGCATLLPWNFFITANEYFEEKLKSDANLKSKFQNYFSVASMAPNLLMMILNVFLMHKFSRYIRMMVSIFVIMVLFAVTSSFVLLDTEPWTQEFFIVTMVILVLLSFSCSALQGALFGMAGLFPSKYIQAVMAGQGLGGFVVCSISILSMFGESNVTRSSFGYFGTGTFAMVISLCAYVYLERLPIVKFYTGNKKECFCTCKCPNICHRVNDETLKDESHEMTMVQPEINYVKIMKKIQPMMISVFVTFFVTLSIFPSATARIKSTSNTASRWTETFFVPVGCFLMYNMFDYFGKSAPSILSKPSDKRPYTLVALACCRVVFIPLFILCNVQPRASNLPIIFEHDALPIIFMAIFAFTGGYFGSLPFMYGPRYVDAHECEVAATMLVFALVAGLASGAAFSFVISPNI